VTTPQPAAAEVAERAGTIAKQTRQSVVGVIENMSWLQLPDGTCQHIFGTGGGQIVADSLTAAVGKPVPLLAQVPLDQRLRECGDTGHPLVLADPSSPAANALISVAERLGTRPRGLAGRLLALTPT
jgi:ATP-binding protein involved in chromosome partitioning